MIKILFIRSPNIYLPEISAYIEFLEGNCPEVKAYDSSQLDDYDLMDFDIVWRFMGFDTKGAGRYVVHEYNSLSAPPFARIKNQIKKTRNHRPDRRIFLNGEVQRGFNFKDGVPANLRDMGVASQFFDVPLVPEYDFVYAGSLYRGGEVLQFIEYVAATLTDLTICIIGDAHSDVRDRYKNNKNITFTGRVAYEDVPQLLAKGRYGLNLMPDRYPFNVQTATKVLEYCALGLPIISTQYYWMEEFVKENNGSVFWLDSDLRNLTANRLQDHKFQTPSAEKYRWENIINSSGIFNFLQNL